MDIKGVLGGLLLIVVAFLVAIFLVPLVAGNDSKEFKVLMGIIIVGAGLYGGVQQLIWQRKRKKDKNGRGAR